MNTTRLFSGIIGLLMLGELLSCTDHRVPAVTPGAARLRVKSLTQLISPAIGTTSAFAYDGQGRLSSITSFQTPDSTIGPVEVSVYQYDPQNRLIQLRRDVVRRGSGTELYAYSYNPAGQVAGISYRNNNPAYNWSVTPQYNADNRIVGNSKSFTVPGVSTGEGSGFTYTGNNLTYVTTTGQAIQTGLTLPAETRTTTYTYDSGINPFYGVFAIPAPSVFGMPPAGGIISLYTYYGGIANVFNLSQNNVLTAVSSNGITTAYTFTYNAANLPTTRITTTGGSVTEVLRYDYENY